MRLTPLFVIVGVELPWNCSQGDCHYETCRLFCDSVCVRVLVRVSVRVSVRVCVCVCLCVRVRVRAGEFVKQMSTKT